MQLKRFYVSLFSLFLITSSSLSFASNPRSENTEQRLNTLSKQNDELGERIGALSNKHDTLEQRLNTPLQHIADWFKPLQNLSTRQKLLCAATISTASALWYIVNHKDAIIISALEKLSMIVLDQYTYEMILLNQENSENTVKTFLATRGCDITEYYQNLTTTIQLLTDTLTNARLSYDNIEFDYLANNKPEASRPYIENYKAVIETGSLILAHLNRLHDYAEPFYKEYCLITQDQRHENLEKQLKKTERDTELFVTSWKQQAHTNTAANSY